MSNDLPEDTSQPVFQEDFFAKIPKGLIYHPALTGNDIRVYATLAERAVTKGRAWPGQRRIAEDLGISRTTVRDAVHRLEAIGAVQVLRRGTPDGNQLTNMYFLPAWGVGQNLYHPGSDSEQGGGSESVPKLDQDTTRPMELEIAPSGAHRPLMNALIEACGWHEDDMSRSMWGQVARYAKELVDMHVEPPEVVRRAQIYRINRSHQTLSPAALVKWWPDCAEPRLPLDGKQVKRAADRADIARRLPDG